MIKNNTLKTLADQLTQNQQQIIEANKQDIESYSGDDSSMLDRLKVDEKKINGMIQSIQQIMSMEDPEGKILFTHQHENGMEIENKTVPFGTILIIYESRPDVTIEAAITAFKAGNKILLKGGKEARNTNLALTDLWHQALRANDVNENYVTYLDISHEETQELIKGQKQKIDLIIPRGGEKLIEFVQLHSKVPLIISGRGNNFLYVDQEADFKMAIGIILNGKQRLSVCNALDKVLINKNLPNLETKLSQLVQALHQHEIEIYGDEGICKLQFNVKKIPDKTLFKEEFLSAKMLLALVENLEQAIEMINHYSGGHSAVIVTSNNQVAEQFLNEVDCAAVYHNASTRFTDGGQLGMGAEMAISTQKLHFRGPVGLNQLVTNKWVMRGSGQIRE